MTTTLPVVAPAGTGAAMAVEVQLVGLATIPLKATEPLACIPKFEPEIVTEAPTLPEFGDKLLIIGAATPQPDNAMVCGLVLASSVIVNVPGLEPVDVGVNVTLIVQPAPAAKLLPQLFVCA